MLTTGNQNVFQHVSSSIIVLAICCSLVRTALASAGCAKFEFSGAEIASDKLILPKGPNIIIHYVLNTNSCPDSVSKTDFTIKIAKRSKDAGFNTDLCKIVYTNGNCHPFRPSECPCPDHTGRYTITKPLALGDETEWIWYTENGERKILIEQRYQLEISQLSFHISNEPSESLESYTVGSSVDILCTYEDGKPMVEPALWKSGQQLSWNIGSEAGKRRRHLQSVTCDDSGTYTCAAPDHPQNKSALLLIACPPIITKKRIKPESKEWKFEVKSYSTSFTTCSLAKDGATTGNPHDCLSKLKVIGSPLSFWVTLLTSDIDLGEDATNGGNWTLTLGNVEGHFIFPFKIHSKNDTSTMPEDEDDDPDDPEEGLNPEHNKESNDSAGATTSRVIVPALLALTALAVLLEFSLV